MKHILLPALLAAASLATAQKLPQPSPLGKVEQVVGLTTITVEYSRPSAKGRTIFGGLVPFGEVWRTGANKCTTIEFDTPVEIAGQPVKAGKYSLFTVPGEESWLVILNRNTDLWGADERKEGDDVLRVKVPRGKVEDPVETFTITFSLGRMDNAVMNLLWEYMWIPIEIHADCTAQALRNIDEALAKPDAKYSAFNNSARFCVERNLRLADALDWAERSVSMEKRYWNTYTLALARAANGKHKEAIAAAEESMRLAQAEKDQNYVSMCRERIEEWTKLVPQGKAPAKSK
ncbi:MAG: DUF2911 domain-containing protein [Flavobacteriales bacterium]